MSRFILRRAARQDLVDIVYHFIREGSPTTARRFRDQAEATFRRLSAMPGMGTPFEHEHPALEGLRYFPISRFKNYIIFYRTDEVAIEVVRALHGARDIQGILGLEFGVEGDMGDDQSGPA